MSDIIIGIDLGTTNSEVAVVQEGRTRIIEVDGSEILPSMVGLADDGALLVGQTARNQYALYPERTVRSVKRRMGELSGVVRKLDAQMVSSVERTRQKVLDELEKLTAKIRRSRQNREGTGLRQIRRLCSQLKPRGRLQERVLTAVPFLVSHGESLAPIISHASVTFGQA